MRLSYEMFGSRNPFLAWVGGAAEQVRQNRQPVQAANPFLAWQEQVSQQVVDGLEAWRMASESLAEETFRAIYGNPALQAALGIDTKSNRAPRKAAKNLLHAELVKARIAELRAQMTQGGPREALIRSLLYVGRALGADERGFEAIRRMRRDYPEARQTTLSEFKAMVRDQYFMLLIDEEAALAAIPGLLPKDIDDRRAALGKLRDVLEAGGTLNAEAIDRLQRVTALFDLGSGPVARVSGARSKSS